MNEVDKTIEYFDKEIPYFAPERYNFSIKMLKKYANSNSSLIDVGCGVGNILEFIDKSINLRRLAGIEPSLNLLSQAKRKGFSVYHGNILDDSFISTINETFDFAILGAVLHHLVGRTDKKRKL